MDNRLRRIVALLGATGLLAAGVAATAPAAAAPPPTGDDAQTLIWRGEGNPYASRGDEPPVATSDGAVWVMSIDGGVARRAADGTWTHHATLPGVDDSRTSTPVSIGTGIAYATYDGTKNRVFEMASDGTTTEVPLAAAGELFRPPFASEPDGSFWYSITSASGAETLVRVTGGGSVSSPLAGPFLQFAAADDGGAWVTSESGLQHVASDGTVTSIALAAGHEVRELSAGTGGAVWYTASVGETGAAVGLAQADGSTTEKTLAGVQWSSLHVLAPQQPSAVVWIRSADGLFYGTSPADVTAVTAAFDPVNWTMVRTGDAVIVADHVVAGNNAILSITPDGTLHLLNRVDGTALRAGVAAPDGTVWFTGSGLPGQKPVVAVKPDGTWLRGSSPSNRYETPATFTSDGTPWFVDDAGIATVDTADVDRIGGDTRYDAAVAIAKAAFPTTAPVVYVAAGASFPDALSAGPAAAQDGGPLLLTPSDRLPSAVADEITSLNPDRIVVVGGPASVSDAVVDALHDLAPTVERVAGADRYAVSRSLVAAHQQSGKPLFVATGAGFADAVTAGAAAARKGGQLLLVPGDHDTLPTATAALIENLHPASIIVVGGRASISDAMFIQLNDYAVATRYDGADRYDVSAAITSAFGTPSSHVYVTTGQNFPDALAAAPLAGRGDSTLVTVPGTCVPVGTLRAIAAAGPSRVTLLGGPASVAPDVSHLSDC